MFVAALLLRVAAAIGLQVMLDQRPGQRFLIEGDANGYWSLGEAIAAGEDFAIYTPPRRVLRMPGFPALLALPIALFPQPMLPARLMLAVVGTLACGLVWWLARVLFDDEVAIRAAALAAVSPVLVGFSPVILSETTFAAALLASLVAMACWIRAAATPSRRVAVFSGLLIGCLVAVGCYVRPSWILAGPLFGLGAIVTAPLKGRTSVMSACVLIGLLGLLLPWGVRNQRVSGHFTLTTFWMGPSLYDGLNPEATGESNMTFYDRDNLMGQGMSEYEVDRHYRAAAWEFVRHQPGRTMQLAGIKLWRYFKPWPNAEQFGGWGPALAIGPFYLAVLLLAARGWWLVRDDVWACALTIGPLLYFAGLHTLFVSSLRYRLPAEYALMVLAAVGWRSLSQVSGSSPTHVSPDRPVAESVRRRASSS